MTLALPEIKTARPSGRRARVALVHERLTELGGAEQVVEQLVAQWPSADVHVPIARATGIPPGLPSKPKTTWLDGVYRLAGRGSTAPLMPLMPMAFRRMALRDVDAVVISHYAFATQASLSTSAATIAYVHSPARWAWDARFREVEAGGRLGGAALRGLAALARRAELAAAPRLDRVVANSTVVAERISRWWGRDDAVVVHPPVDTAMFSPDPSVSKGDFFLFAGRLVPYKRADVAIAAATAAGVPLVVAGEGRHLDYCRSIAGNNVTFVGRVSDEQLRHLFRQARALLMPGVEDFGIVPVEAMACGTPVLAVGEGGTLDTVVPSVTGQLVPGGTDKSLVAGFAAAMREFDDAAYRPAHIRRHAERFSPDVFRARMQAVVDDALAS